MIAPQPNRSISLVSRRLSRNRPRGSEWPHERRLACSGVDEGRVWDVIAVVRLLEALRRHVEKERKPNWRVIGEGNAGVLAAYAALFEPDITEVVVINPPSSHHNGPVFLNVLRVVDIPEALGLLAPRKLTLINAKDKAFDRTVEIYKLAGAADKITRK